MSWGWYYNYSRPPLKKVKGGIRAQSKRGKFGQSWWAARWNETLEEYDIGERLSRGKTYARTGRVSKLDIKKGRVVATVHGSEKYKVDIAIKKFQTAQWEKVAQKMLANPLTVARLLSGRMPDDIEDVFKDLRLRLFPSMKDLETDCTCPDWANPCKHIAAIFLLMAEEFDRDPFMLFRLRGIDRGELLEMAGLGKRKSKNAGSAGTLVPKEVVGGKKKNQNRQSTTDPFMDGMPGHAGVAAKTDTAGQQKISADPFAFWGQDSSSYEPGDITAPSIPAALVKQLGSFPFWRGEDNFVSAMEEIYKNASETGASVVFGSSNPAEDKKQED